MASDDPRELTDAERLGRMLDLITEARGHWFFMRDPRLAQSGSGSDACDAGRDLEATAAHLRDGLARLRDE